MRSPSAPQPPYSRSPRLQVELLEDRRVLAVLGGLTNLSLVSALVHDAAALSAAVRSSTPVQATPAPASSAPPQSAAEGQAALIARLEAAVSEVLQPILQGIEDAAHILADGGADPSSSAGPPPPSLAPVGTGGGRLPPPESILDIPVVVPVPAQPRPDDEGAGNVHADPGLRAVVAQPAASDSAPRPSDEGVGNVHADPALLEVVAQPAAGDSVPPPADPATVDVTVRLAPDAARPAAQRPVFATASGSLTLDAPADGPLQALSDGAAAQAGRPIVPVGLLTGNAAALVHAETVAGLLKDPGVLNGVLREVEYVDRVAREEPMPLPAMMDRHFLTAVIEHEGHALVLDGSVAPPPLAVATRPELVVEAEAVAATPPLAFLRTEDGETAWGWLTSLSPALDLGPLAGGWVSTVEVREVSATPVTVSAVADVASVAGLASGALPADADALRQAVQEFLGQLDTAGRDLTSALTDSPWAPWLAAAAVAAVAAESARRRLRRLAARGTPAEWTEDGTLSWHSGFHPFRSAEA